MDEQSNKKVSVLIATFATQDYLEHCLESLQAQTLFPQEIIVIDNSLNPGFSQKIAGKFPCVKLYPSPEKLSYCESLNKGIRSSQGDFVLCLNDDVVLDQRFIEEALKGFDRDVLVGMVSGKILRTDGQTIDSAGLFLSVFRTAKERGYGRKDKGKFEKEDCIFGVCGAAAFYRRGMLEDLKEEGDYFDPDFGFFYEDLDIAWRSRRAGWRGYYRPSALAYHVRGGTLRQKDGINKPYARRYLNDELYLDLVKNRYLAVIKNDSCLSFLAHLPFFLAYDIAQWTYLFLFKPPLVKKFFSRLYFLKKALRKRVFSVGRMDSSIPGKNQK